MAQKVILAALYGLGAALLTFVLLWLLNLIGAAVAVYPWPLVVGVLVFLLYTLSGYFPPRR